MAGPSRFRTEEAKSIHSGTTMQVAGGVSGSAPLVPMVQPANLRNGDDPSSTWRLNRSRLRAVFLQCQMGPAAMVIINEQFEMPVQTALVEYDHMIEAFAAKRADHSFDIRTLPW